MSASEIYRPIRETVLADDWGRLTKYEYELKRRSGAWQHQVREAYDRGNGATCLLYNPDTDCVLLTRQFRLPVYMNGGETALIETPAGLLEGAEPAQRMRAELIEETGYAITELDFLFNAYMSPGSVTEFVAFFRGYYSEADRTAEGGGLHDEGEDIEVLHVPLPRAMDMIISGEIRDAKTIMLLQHLMLERCEAKRDQTGIV